MTGRVFKLFEDEEVTVPEEHWVLPGITTAYNTADDYSEGYEVVGGSVTVHVVEEVAGHDFSEIDGDYWGSQELLLVSPEPFGALTWYGDVDDKGRRLKLARQIHKGELGRFPTIPRLTVVFDQERARSNPEHHTNGWVRLTELAGLSELSIRELLTEFWPVMDYDWTPSNEPRTHLMYGQPSDIRSGRVRFEERTQAQILQALNDWESWDDIWIRRGTARAILHLLQFGKRFDPPSVHA